MKAGITQKPFGTFEQKPVTEYTITNANGMSVSVINSWWHGYQTYYTG